MSLRSWWMHRWGGLLVGAATTLLLCAAWAAGTLERWELFGRTLLLRYAGTIEEDPRIVLIDIDDSAFERVHRWPWPRRLHANLIDTLRDLGAKAIVVDLVFAEATPPRVDSAYLGPHHHVDPPVELLGSDEPPVWIFDDDELAAAIARAGNVYLAMYFSGDPPPATRQARAAAAAFLRTHPEADWPAFHAHILPGEPFDHESPRRLEYLLAWRNALASRAVREKAGPGDPAVAAVPQ